MAATAAPKWTNHIDFIFNLFP